MQPLFQPFRALGYISDDVPFAVQRRGKETFVTVSVGKAWQVSSFQYSLSRVCSESLSGVQLAVESVGVLFLQAWSEASGPSGVTIEMQLITAHACEAHEFEHRCSGSVDEASTQVCCC